MYSNLFYCCYIKQKDKEIKKCYFIPKKSCLEMVLHGLTYILRSLNRKSEQNVDQF